MLAYVARAFSCFILTRDTAAFFTIACDIKKCPRVQIKLHSEIFHEKYSFFLHNIFLLIWNNLELRREFHSNQRIVEITAESRKIQYFVETILFFSWKKEIWSTDHENFVSSFHHFYWEEHGAYKISDNIFPASFIVSCW